MVCVIDFDRTFLLNDYFMETFFRKLLDNPAYLIRHFLVSKESILALKKKLLSEYLTKHTPKLLINPSVDAWIRDNRARYDKIILVSASPDFFVKQLLSGYTSFDEVHGSKEMNLKGRAKLDFIKQQYGDQFDYMGDARADHVIFNLAQRAFKVNGKQIMELD